MEGCNDFKIKIKLFASGRPGGLGVGGAPHHSSTLFPLGYREPSPSPRPLSLSPCVSFFQSKACSVGRGASANLHSQSGRHLYESARQGGGPQVGGRVMVWTHKAAQSQQVCEECLSVQTTGLEPGGWATFCRTLLSVTLDLATSRYFIYSQPVIKHLRIIWLSNADEISAWNKIIMKDRWDQFAAYDSKHPSPKCQQEILRFPNNKHILGFRVFARLVFTA